MGCFDWVSNLFGQAKAAVTNQTYQTPSPLNPSFSTLPQFWQIGPILDGKNDSPGMPSTPPADGAAWMFNFPPVDGVHYVTTGWQGSIAAYKTMHLVFALDGTGPIVSVDGGAPLLRMYFQRTGDDWSGSIGNMEGYRWWAGAKAQSLSVSPGVFIVDVDLTDGTQWTDVYANDGVKQAALFAAAKNDVQCMGFTFGGMFAGHGCYAKGPATFHLREFSLK
jgi:hypothetical protein